MGLQLRGNTYGFLGVGEESLSGIGDSELALGVGSRTVDTGSGLGRVATHEPVITCH